MEKYFFSQYKNGKVTVAGNLSAKLGTNIKGEGFFAEWNWDGNTFTLHNDRYGFYPVYYAREGNKFAVSSSITKLLQLGFDPELNFKALSVFLRFSSFIGEDTAFKSIRSVPPGTRLKWEDGILKIDSDGIIIKRAIKISRKEAIATYAELFQKAIEKTLPEDNSFVVPLSGGRDSRHILFSLCQAEKFPEACVTAVHNPPRANEDARIARIICEKLNIKHRLVKQTQSRILTEREKNLITGFTAYEHGWFLSLADNVKDKWKVIYDGIGGDMLSQDHFFNEEEFYLYKEGKLPELADRFLQKEAYLPNLLESEIYSKTSRQIAQKEMIREMEKHLDAPNPFSSFYLWNRTRRCVALSFFRIFGDKFKIITPFFDSDLFDFLSSLPGEIFFGNTLHEETINAAFPQYADIPYEDLNASLNLDISNFKNFSSDILRYSISKRNTELTNRRFFLTRCLRGMFDKNYGRNITDFGDLSILLMQLERLDSEILTHLASPQPDQFPKPATPDTKPRQGFPESQLRLPS
jgi:hypothetical protein